MLARLAAATPRTEYVVAEERLTVTDVPVEVVTTIVASVLLATVPKTGAG
jgi:hypothetical protein